VTDATQLRLDPLQLTEFYHDEFVKDQVAEFRALVGPLVPGARVVDLGGGIGHFASALARETGARVEVIDSDPESVRRCADQGVPATTGDAITTRAADGAEVATFNMILHHLVTPGFDATRALQVAALANLARPRGPRRVFVNEYIYEGLLVPSLSAAAIFRVTSSGLLSRLAAAVARVVPSLRANTFGVGVRFRDAADWRRMFDAAGWRVIGHVSDRRDKISFARRVALALNDIRQDSFLLERS